MVFVFNADGTYSNTSTNPFSNQRSTENGTFSIESPLGDTIQAQLTEANGRVTITFTMLEATHVRMRRADEPISFVLAKS